MIACEHFIYSLATGLITSPKLEKMLTPLELDFLCHIGDKEKTKQCFRTKINKFVVALTYIEPIQDEYKRTDIWNHTILVEYQAYFNDRESHPLKLVGPHFVQPSGKSPRTLEPIKI